MGPPSSGGVHVIQMLNVLKQSNLNELGHNSSKYINLLAEVMKFAYADRSKYLGDSDFYERIANSNPIFPYLKSIHPTDFEQHLSFS